MNVQKHISYGAGCFAVLQTHTPLRGSERARNAVLKVKD